MTGPERSAEKPQRAAKTAVDGEDAAVVVEADLVVVEEVVALAGRDHVVVAVGADLHRAVPSFLAATAATAAKRFGWVSLPPKPPPMRRTMMVTAFDGHAEDVRDHVLHLARVLGRGVDGDVVVLAGDGEGDHALEVEVVLAADAHARP